MTVGQLTSLNGFVPFPADSLWNKDISSAMVDPNSDNIINFIGADVTLHPDFGSGTYAGQSIGIPYQVVAGSHPKVRILLGAYADESDRGHMPIPYNALIEGYPKPGNGDRHVLVLDKDNCWLYELYHGRRQTRPSWSADSTAVWDMTIDEQRPYTWTSADAAGLPIFPGLARYDEVAAGAINHALRFTVPVTRQAFTPPASHWASSNTSADAPPMGMRLRLKASFDISGFSPANQVILTTLKKYGMILADNGSAIYISGAPDHRWDNSDLGNLKTITAQFRGRPDGPGLHQRRRSDRRAARDRQFQGESQIDLGWTNRDVELDDERRKLQPDRADNRAGARHQHHDQVVDDADVRPALDQSVWAIGR
jgi:hypothetical protein